MKAAGAGVPSADRITMLRGLGVDGIAATRGLFLRDLHSQLGMALVGNAFYVANTDAVMRFNYREDDTRIAVAGVNVLFSEALSSIRFLVRSTAMWGFSLMAATNG